MKQYTKAELELLLLETKDVILTSTPFSEFDATNSDESSFGFDLLP